jgi:hypothetical protein
MAKMDPVVPMVEEGAGESFMDWARANSRTISVGAMVVVAVAASQALPHWPSQTFRRYSAATVGPRPPSRPECFWRRSTTSRERSKTA